MLNNVDAVLLMTDIESDSMLLNFFCSVAFHTVGILSLATILVVLSEKERCAEQQQAICAGGCLFHCGEKQETN